MKQLLSATAIIGIVTILMACNNNGGASGDLGDSTTSPSINTDNSNTGDTIGSRQGDTASYNRMSQHTDSMR